MITTSLCTLQRDDSSIQLRKIVRHCTVNNINFNHGEKPRYALLGSLDLIRSHERNVPAGRKERGIKSRMSGAWWFAVWPFNDAKDLCRGITESTFVIDTRSKSRCHLSILHRSRSWTDDVGRRRRNGRWRWVSSTISPSDCPEGSPRHDGIECPWSPVKFPCANYRPVKDKRR